MIDKATSEEHGITSMSQLANADIASLFDIDGRGQADIVGCNEGWACNTVIDSHIAEFGWGANVRQKVGDYSQMIRDEVQPRVAAGEPVLFYAWTPNWTYEALPAGTDVVWLQSDAMDGDEGTTAVAGLPGCAGGANPCDLGWPINSIRAVANSDFLDDNPQIERLLEQVTIPLEDISAQNAQQASQQDYSEEQIVADARKWIADNRDMVDSWLAEARG